MKGEFKATRNGKTITILLSVHKAQHNVFTVEKVSEPIKKIIDRTCQYCGKEFRYPSILKRHLKLKNMCSEQSSQVNDRVSLISDRISPTSDRVSPTTNQIDKKTVPIYLSLA